MIQIEAFALNAQLGVRMLPVAFEQIDAGTIAKICGDQAPESDTLDFKRELPGSGEADRSELLKDVCALANADGGDLVYGIDEMNGTATSIAPLHAPPGDAATRRMLQIIDAGVEPRIAGLQIKHVPVPGGYVIVVRVPASFAGPHCVRQGSARRFVIRNGTTTTDLSMDQLRLAFDRSATLAARAEEFIARRIDVISSVKTPKRLVFGPTKVVHFVPLSGVSGRHAVDLHVVSKEFAGLIDQHWGGGNRTFNLDGLVVHPSPSNEGHDGYVQVFRHGALEAAALAGGEWRENEKDSPTHVIWPMTQFFRERTASFLDAAKRWGFSGPAVLGFALIRSEGYGLALNRRPRRNPPKADRPNLVLSPAWIEDIASANLDDVVRPLMDTLWQAFGLSRCDDFDPMTGRHV